MSHFVSRGGSHLLPSAHNSPGSSVFDLPTQSESRDGIGGLVALPAAPFSSVPRSRTPTASRSGTTPSPSHLVISGGTGGNAICSAFDQACFVLPVSDDGGSSSEIIRVLGGPSVGG